MVSFLTLWKRFALDNCGTFEITQTPEPGINFGGMHGDILTVLLIIEDDNNNKDTCEVDLFLNDNENPSIDCPDDVVIPTSAGGTGDCAGQYGWRHPLGFDNCQVAQIDLTIDGPISMTQFLDVTPNAEIVFDFDHGETELTYTITDLAGNQYSCVWYVQVYDDEDPQIICPADIFEGTSNGGLGDCFGDASWTVPTPTDNCGFGAIDRVDEIIEFADGTAIGMANVTIGGMRTVTFPKGTSTVIYTAYDTTGNSSSCSFEVTIEDDEIPMVDCSDIPTEVSADPLTCSHSIVTGEFDPIWGDNCPDSSIVHNYPFSPDRNTLRGTLLPVGVHTIVWTVTDCGGNTNSCEVTITVTDDERPEILNCPGQDIVVDNDNNQCEADVTLPQIIAHDNCTPSHLLVIEYSFNMGGIWEPRGAVTTRTFPVGTSSVWVRAIDTSGNISAICMFNVVVLDNEPPNAICNPVTLVVGPDCEATVTAEQIAGFSTDNCGIVELLISRTNDPNGLMPSLDFDFDDYANSPITVWARACDAAGNCTWCATSVTLVDEENPVVVCPPDMTINTEPGRCHGVVPDLSAMYSDNCDVFMMSQIPPAGVNFGGNHGDQITVQLFVEDDMGNMDTCDVILTLNDNENPEVFCPLDVVIPTSLGGEGDCEALYEWLHPVPGDNCNVNDFEVTFTDPDGMMTTQPAVPGGRITRIFQSGITTITYTVYDDNNNTDQCSFTVTVVDDEEPVVVCPADVTIGTSANGTGDCTSSFNFQFPTPSDNCGEGAIEFVSVTVQYANGNAAGPVNVGYTPGLVIGVTINALVPGDNVVTLCAIDTSGNEGCCMFTITVVDDEDPMIDCSDIPTEFTTDPGTCEYLVRTTEMDPFASDNCMLESVEHNYPFAPHRNTLRGATFFTGETEVIWTATDEEGNMASCTINVTVIDDEAPYWLNCPDSLITIANDPGWCGAVANFDRLIALDNCTPVSLITYEYSLDLGDTWVAGHANNLFYDVGLHDIWYRATDTAGNVSDTCMFQIDVVDKEDPEAVCVPVTVTVDDDCEAFVTAEMIGFLSSDNCGIDSFKISRDTINWMDTLFFNRGDLDSTPITVFLLVCDSSGNCSICATLVHLVDADDPELVCPPDVTINTVNDACYVELPDFTALSISDNCGVYTIEQEPPPGTNVGSRHGQQVPVLLIITDLQFNRDTCEIIVTLNDNTNPMIRCPHDVIINTSDGGTGDCEGEYQWSHPLPIDNCAIESLSMLITAENGDIIENNPSVPLGARITYDFPVGINRVLYIASDSAGNQTTCFFYVEVLDDEAPDVTCPPDVEDLECDDVIPDGVTNYDDFISIGGIISDNCTVLPESFTVRFRDENNGNTFCDDDGLFVFTRTYIITDSVGNETECQQRFIFSDDSEGPEFFDIPPDTVVTCAADVPPVGTVGVTDICTELGNIFVDFSEFVTFDSCQNKKLITRRWIAYDQCGNSDVAIYNILVRDTIAPEIFNVPENVTVTCQEDIPAAPVNVFALDNCHQPVFIDFSEVTVPMGCDDNYDIVRSWVAYDDCGNQADSSYTVSVRDEDPPVITGGEDVEFDCEDGTPNNNAQLISWLNNNAGATAEDMCSNVTWTNDYHIDNWVDGCGNTRYVDVVFTATDECGNSASITQRFGTVDNEAPSFLNCPGLPVVENTEFGHCDAYVNFSAPLATDNCSDTVTVVQIDDTGLTSGSRFPIGVTILWFAAFDECGNSDTCSVKVIVNDYWEVPTITCPPDTMLNNDLDICGVYFDEGDMNPTAEDFCAENLLLAYHIVDDNGDTISLGFDEASQDLYPVGRNEVLFYVQDQPLVLITEVTHWIDATVGPTNPIPGFITGDRTDGDYVEVSNFGTANVDMTCVTLEVVDAGGSICSVTLPEDIVVEPGEVVTFYLGDGVDDPANRYFNVGCAADAMPNEPRGYILSLYNRVISAVGVNGFDPVGFGTLAVVEEDDWSGTSPMMECYGSYYYDPKGVGPDMGRSTRDFRLAEACEPATIGSFNPNLEHAFPSGNTVSLQSTDPGWDTCTTVVIVVDVEDPTCAEYDTTLYAAPIDDPEGFSNGDCYTSVINIPDVLTVGEIRVVQLIGTYGDMGEVEMTLISPSGTAVQLFEDLCPGTSNFDVNLDDNAPADISFAGCGPLGQGGTFRPEQPLSEFYQEQANGDWTLQIELNNCDDQDGTLESWGLEILSIQPYSQGDTVIQNDPGECGASFTWVHPVIEDNCCFGTIEVVYTYLPTGTEVRQNIVPGAPVTRFFPEGETRVQYFLTDCHGNEGTCEFIVDVEDTENPFIVNCPDTIIISLDPGECGTRFFFNYETVDNCGVDSIQVIPPNGTYLPIGTHRICVIAYDPSGNTDTCKFDVVVEEYIPANTSLACNDQVNISLDADCEVIINADMILEGNNHGCYDNYIIEILELPFLTPHDSVLTIEDVGKCFQVTITDPRTGNSCWGRLCVEDKQIPEIECPNDTIVGCNSPVDPSVLGSPVLLTCEASITISHVDSVVYYDDCDDIRVEIWRKWLVTDESGNTVGCTQLIQIRGFDLADIVFPPHYDDIDNPALECYEAKGDDRDVSQHIVRRNLCVDGYLLDSAYWIATGGNPALGDFSGERRPMVLGWNQIPSGPNAGHPSPYHDYYPAHFDYPAGCWGPNTNVKWRGTGVPTINGTSIYSNNAYCAMSIRYDDEVYDICGNTYEILRYWKIRDMCRRVQAGVNPIEFIQVIKIIDRNGPEVIYPTEVNVGMDPWQCYGTWDVPEPWIVDDCQDSTWYEVQTYAGRAIQRPNGRWVVEGLPAGVHTVIINAFDACHRRTQHKITVTVVDDVPPVAVCDAHTVVSLSGNQVPGLTLGVVDAEDFDDGSFDNCGPVYFKAVRMIVGECDGLNGDDHPLSPGYDEWPDDQVVFCCDDITKNPIMVRLLVFDIDPGEGPVNPNLLRPGAPYFEHYTECMVEVEVQDKAQPTIVAPPTIVASCDFWFDINALEDPNDPTFGRIVTDLADRAKVKTYDIVCPEWCEPNLKYLYFPPAGVEEKCALYDPIHPETKHELLWGFDGYILSSCNASPRIIVNDQRQCGQGRIIRTFTASGPGGVVTATQTIFFVDCNPFYINDENCFDIDPDDGVVWPCNVELTDCGPDISPSTVGEPEIKNEDNCSLIAVQYRDEVFDIVPDACFKILRHWTIIDWCQYDPTINLLDGRWEYTQIILVNDNEEPEFAVCEDVTFCDDAASYDDQLGLCVGIADLIPDVSDACTMDSSRLVFEYKIDAFNTGQFDYISSEDDQVIDNNPFAFDEHNARDASGRYPIGTHRIVWHVEDMCGNLATCEYLFTVEDCKKPTPYCQDIITVIMPSTGEITVWANDFDAGSFDNCPGDLGYYFDSLGLESSMTVSCDDFEAAGVEFELVLSVKMWVRDEAGNTDYCTVNLIVQDPNGICDDNNIKHKITGLINTEDQKGVAEVEVQLNSDIPGFPVYQTTENNGNYVFENLPAGKDYMARPERNDDPMNGISTKDLVLIQKHLLGIEELPTPFKMIAADVDNSKHLSAKDLLQLRKLILGKTIRMEDIEPDQRSWRFVDADHIFEDPKEPWLFPEVKFYLSLSEDVSGDFVGIKIGDVDNSTKPNDFASTQSRSNQSLIMTVDNDKLVKGTEYIMEVKSDNFDQISGYQFTLNFDNDALQVDSVSAGKLDITSENFGLHVTNRGMITTSWHSHKSHTFTKDDVLFRIHFRVMKNVHVEDLFDIGSGITVAEAYHKTNDLWNVKLAIRNGADVELVEAVKLYQNQPNPFKDKTTISFDLPEDMAARLTIYDVTGKVLRIFEIDGSQGYNELTVKRNELNSTGVLYYQLDTEDYTETKRMMLLD